MSYFTSRKFWIFLVLPLSFLFISTFLFSACGDQETVEGKISKKIKIELSDDVAGHGDKVAKNSAKARSEKSVQKKASKKKTHKNKRSAKKDAKAKKAGVKKPDIKWVNPKRAARDSKKKKSLKKSHARKSSSKTRKITRSSTKVAKSGSAPKPNYVISLASFKDKTGAKAMARRLTSAGYKAHIMIFAKDSVRWYRVRVGFFSDYPQAKKLRDKLVRLYSAKGAWIDKPSRAEVAEFAK